MAARHGIHPEALSELAESVNHYRREVSANVAGGFVTEVESAITAIIAAPMRWRIVDEPEIRRCVLQRYPFAIFYRWEPLHERAMIYAIAHGSREPNYWRHRLD